MEKTNTQVHLTKKALRESLVALMKTKSILNITVREICEAAGVSRTTFYTYFKDQYDLLEQHEEKILGKFHDLILKYYPSDEALSPRELVEMIERILRYITRNVNSMQVLLSENGESGFQRKLAVYLTGCMWKLSPPKKDGDSILTGERSLKYRSVFISDGLIAILQEWLKNDMDMNVHDTAKIFAKLLRSVPG